MIRMRTLSALVAASLMAGCNGAAMAGASQDKASATAVRCEIVVTRSGGSTTIAGVVRPGAAITGDYALKVDGSGVRIRQGGAFSADAGEQQALGEVRLGRGSYDATMDITVDGLTTRCAQPT